MMIEIDKNIPLCKCHNIEMLWHKKNDRKRGGSWQCRVKAAKCRRDRENSPQGWVIKRKYTLNKMRENIINQLEELQNG